MPNAVALYRSYNAAGDTQVAVRKDGRLFRRYRQKTIYGWTWTRWQAQAEVWGENMRASPPSMIEAMSGWHDGFLEAHVSVRLPA